jgi:transposase
MPLVYIMAIAVEDRLALEDIVARGRDWRCRERAKTLLLLDSGLSAAAVAAELKLNVRTILTTRRAWFGAGLASLPDRVRTGAPRKITDDDLTKIAAAASAQPLSGRQLLGLHVAAGGVPVSLSTMTAALKSAGMVWKRTRYSLKKSATKPPSE